MTTNWDKTKNWGAQLRLLMNHPAAAAQGDLKAGQILALAGDVGSEKLYKLARDLSVGAAADESDWEDTGVNGNTFDGAEVQVYANKPQIIPGTVTLSVEGTTATNNATDNGYGILKKSDNTVVGAVDYEAGIFVLRYPAAPALATGNAKLKYRHKDPDGKAVPYGVLVSDVSTGAAGSTDDVDATVLVMGDIPEEALVFTGPGAPGADEKARAVAGLRRAGVHVTAGDWL